MKHIPAPTLQLAAAMLLAVTACGHRNGTSAIGSADGPTAIYITDGAHTATTAEAASTGIIGGADGTTTITVADKGSAHDAAEKILAAKGMELIGRMASLAGSSGYPSLMTSSQSVLDEIALIAAADYAVPNETFVIDGAAFASDTTDFVNTHIREKAIRSAAAMINGLNGTQALAASAILQVDDAFVCDGADHPLLYLYAFDAPYSAMVSYVPRNDGTVTATASFVRFTPTGSAAISRHVAEAIGSALGSTDITVRSIDLS